MGRRGVEGEQDLREKILWKLFRKGLGPLTQELSDSPRVLKATWSQGGKIFGSSGQAYRAKAIAMAAAVTRKN